MCRHFPKTASEMRRIPGVGDVKLERYGEEFLEAIRPMGKAIVAIHSYMRTLP